MEAAGCGRDVRVTSREGLEGADQGEGEGASATSIRVTELLSKPAALKAADAFSSDAKWKKGSAGLPASAAGSTTSLLPCSAIASIMISKPLGAVGVCTLPQWSRWNSNALCEGSGHSEAAGAWRTGQLGCWVVGARVDTLQYRRG